MNWKVFRIAFVSGAIVFALAAVASGLWRMTIGRSDILFALAAAAVITIVAFVAAGMAYFYTRC